MESLRRKLGDLSQIASGRFVRLDDGPEVGVRAVDVRVAGGLHALVLIDRGLDIGPAWVGGFPISWQSPTGIVHPAYYNDDVWLRSFYGGLMFTAGLRNVGPATRQGTEIHGLHGRLSNLPARDVRVDVAEDERGLAVVVSGRVRETSVYGPDLVLHRRIRFAVGEPLIEISDEVENAGFLPCPVFILYHVNLGYPVVDETSRWIGPATNVVGFDDVSRAAESEYNRFASPSRDFPVQAFEHLMPASSPRQVVAAVVNDGHGPSGGIGVSVTFDRELLPRLWQWRMLREGLYLTGIEPSNCGIAGRLEELEAGPITILEPGERRPFGIAIRAVLGEGINGLL